MKPHHIVVLAEDVAGLLQGDPLRQQLGVACKVKELVAGEALAVLGQPHGCFMRIPVSVKGI